MALRVLVCGGLDYRDADAVCRALDAVHAKRGISAVIQGGADGADRLAANWAMDRKIPLVSFNADWKSLGLKAGSIRNQRMIDEGVPDAVVAFLGGALTADMVRRAKASGLPVWNAVVEQP